VPLFVLMVYVKIKYISCHLTYLLTHDVEPFLRSRQLCSHSRTSQHFMEPEGSISCSQEPSTSPYPEPYQSNIHHSILSYLSKIHFNIVQPPSSHFTFQNLRKVHWYASERLTKYKNSVGNTNWF
jgi:hypothetical protein